MREEIDCCDDEPRCAEAALHGTGLDERLLHAVQLPVFTHALNRDDVVAVRLSCEHQAGADERSAEHEPHSPCSHAFFEPGSPSRSRRAKRRLSPSQTSASTGSPLTVSSIFMRGTVRARGR